MKKQLMISLGPTTYGYLQNTQHAVSVRAAKHIGVSTIVRATLDALALSNIDLAGCASAADVQAAVLAALTGGDHA